MSKRVDLVGLSTVVFAFAMPIDVSGQTPGTASPAQPGGRTSTLGPTPGMLPDATAPQEPQGYLGGRPGGSTPRVPFSTVRPLGTPDVRQPTDPIPLALPTVSIPVYGPLGLPATFSEGPADGLTLEMAIEILLRENLALKARALELNQADADITTAGLRPNPILFADSQLVPYGSYDQRNPGGPTQYDLNVTYPIDVSGKRRARVRSATQTRRVLEAQYRDAIRVEVDVLYRTYVDVLAGREVVRFAKAGVAGLDEALKRTESLFREGAVNRVDLNRIVVQRDAALIALEDAEVVLRRARRVLGTLLNMTPSRAETIEPLGTLRGTDLPLRPTEELAAIALRSRPDAIAFRLGIGLADAEYRLARANRYEDVFLLYQPYTLQANSSRVSGRGVDQSTSWALGITVPLPISNRNQGNIERARVNITQSQMELEALERRIVAEVKDASSEYEASRSAVNRVEDSLIPRATEIVEDSYQLYISGEESAIDYLDSRRNYNDVVRQYVTALIRHRRGMLGLNTAVGRVILP